MDLPPEILCHIYQQTTDVITLARLLQTHSSVKAFLNVCVKELTLDPDQWIDVPISFITQFAHVEVISFPISLRTERDIKNISELKRLKSTTLINETRESLPHLVSIMSMYRSMWPSKFLFVDERTKNIIATNELYDRNGLILSQLRKDYSLISDGLANSVELSQLVRQLIEYSNIEILIIDLLHISNDILTEINRIRLKYPNRLAIYATSDSPFELLFRVANNLNILSSATDFYNYELSGYLDDLNETYPNLISLIGLFNLDDFLTIIDKFPNLQKLGIYSNFDDLIDPVKLNRLNQTLRRLPLRIKTIIIYTDHPEPQIPSNYFSANKQINLDFYYDLIINQSSLIQFSYPYFTEWFVN